MLIGFGLIYAATKGRLSEEGQEQEQQLTRFYDNERRAATRAQMVTNHPKPLDDADLEAVGGSIQAQLEDRYAQSETQAKPKRTRKPRTTKKKSDVTVKVGDIPTPTFDSHKKDSPHQTRKFRGSRTPTVH